MLTAHNGQVNTNDSTQPESLHAQSSVPDGALSTTSYQPTYSDRHNSSKVGGQVTEAGATNATDAEGVSHRPVANDGGCSDAPTTAGPDNRGPSVGTVWHPHTFTKVDSRDVSYTVKGSVPVPVPGEVQGDIGISVFYTIRRGWLTVPRDAVLR